ncbi:STAS domain-containing protein [Marilutibacter aestuarii]|uniref:STAS domain-containing protein n=1 Tax=Marilutibacter aestuarii TaxID=1706195 RepID=A0A508A029_9GAMM|nr:STAS domain-containing protein [Lysobacter aestuarii]TQD43360.1 STAS domain-containing protein [Lysobacter aestuarii]
MAGTGPLAGSARREGDALVFAGTLDRDACAGVWAQASGLLDGVTRFDLAHVARIDSAGLALLAELADRAGAVTIQGSPEGLAELRSAYRLDARLAYGG